MGVLFAALLLAGCGGGGGSSSNGLASQTPQQVIAAAQKAAAGASSVRIAGNIVSNGTPITLDLTLAKGKGATGSMSTNGLSFDLMRIGNTVYIKGSEAFLKHYAGAGAAQLLNGKWLKGTTSGQFGALVSLTNAGKFFAKIGGNHGKLVNKGETTYNGDKVVWIEDTTEGGKLYVAATGTPFPLALEGSSTSHSGTITFTNWNQPVNLSPPKGAIDISQLGAG